MAEHILNMIKASDPEAIQKYVKYHLPNDPVSLQRIYKQLLTYDIPPDQQKKLNSTRRSKSVKSIISAPSSESSQYKRKNTSEDQIIKSVHLIKKLKDKGLKVDGNCEEEGLTLYESHRERLVKPLLTNTRLLKSEEALIDRLILRYTINSQFYKDKMRKGSNNKQQIELDPEMKDFLSRRQSLLEVLRNQNTHKSLINPKFTNIQSKFTQSKGIRVSYERIPSLKKSEQKLAGISSSNKLMNICEDQIRQQKYKTIDPQINYFRDLQSQVQKNTIYNHYSQLQNAKTFKQKMEGQQYKRYTHSYIDMLTKKIRTGSKCKLSAYDKDLLRDAKRMRNIIDFSSQ